MRALRLTLTPRRNCTSRCMWRYKTVLAINASMPTHPMVVRRIQRLFCS